MPSRARRPVLVPATLRATVGAGIGSILGPRIPAVSAPGSHISTRPTEPPNGVSAAFYIAVVVGEAHGSALSGAVAPWRDSNPPDCSQLEPAQYGANRPAVGLEPTTPARLTFRSRGATARSSGEPLPMGFAGCPSRGVTGRCPVVRRRCCRLGSRYPPRRRGRLFCRRLRGPRRASLSRPDPPLPARPPRTLRG